MVQQLITLKITYLCTYAQIFEGGLGISTRNRKTRVILLKTRVGTGTRVLEKMGFKIIPSQNLSDVQAIQDNHWDHSFILSQNGKKCLFFTTKYGGIKTDISLIYLQAKML